MNEIQIDILQTKLVEGRVERGDGVILVCIPQFRGDEKVLTRHARLAYSFAHTRFIAVNRSSIDVAIPHLDCHLD